MKYSTRKSYGTIDDVTATYCGNQIATMRDDAADVLLESSLDMPHGAWSGSDFAYDRNGNQTRDLSRGVSDIQYNELNLPVRIEMSSGGTIEYLYTAAGTKLAEIIRDQEGVLLNRRDYVGMFEFESDSLRAIALASGFVSAADTTFHLYVHDYQGNVTGVYNTRSGALEQFTDFYPYGLPHAMTRSGDKSTNRRLYGAKELTTDHGLNAYDFEARWLAPALPSFTSPAPLSEKYKNLSPYAYCACDPINLIDPTGMKFQDGIADELLKALNKRREQIQKEVDKINATNESKGASSDSKDNPDSQSNRELSDPEKELCHIDQAISDVELLEKDKDHLYILSQDDNYISHKVTKGDGNKVIIQYPKLALAFHEITHIRQSLNSSKGLQFNDYGELKNAGSTAFKMLANEAEAFRIQFAFDRSSMHNDPGRVSNINISFLRRIKTPSKEPAFPLSWEISEDCNLFIDKLLYRH